MGAAGRDLVVSSTSRKEASPSEQGVRCEEEPPGFTPGGVYVSRKSESTRVKHPAARPNRIQDIASCATIKFSLTPLALVCLGLAGAGSVCAQQRELDLRKVAGEEHVVAFCGRPSPDSAAAVPAHAFLAFSHKTGAGDREYLAVGTVSGVQPKALLGFSTAIAPVPARLSEPNYAALQQRCLSLLVDRADYQRSMRLARRSLEAMASSAPAQPVAVAYGLPAEECVKLFVNVANGFAERGVKVPERRDAELPLSYLRRLIDQNVGAARAE
jgi:hypothetical protein